MRDGGKCVICGSIEDLCGHHMDGWQVSVDGRDDIENGVCVCRKHHVEFHHLFGIGSSTKEEWIKYLEQKGVK